MRYYFDGDSNLYGYETKQLSFPAKVKQMGAIDNRIKIYMEDYVYTYLYQYGRSSGNTEKVAALVGRYMKIEEQDVLLICGAIQGKYAVQENGMLMFGAETWEYIGNQMETYFHGMALVGWVHCQPGFGSFLMAKDEVFHKNYFQEHWQVLFVLDSVDKMDTFYLYNEEQSALQQARGYFIYYEKNEEMQEYMLEHSMIKPKEEEPEQKQQTTPQKTTPQEENRRPTPEERMDAAQEIRRVLQRRAKEVEQTKKGRYTMLTSMSCVLCLICVCMGYALWNNVQRVQNLESEMAMVQNSYVDLAESIQIQAAFAEQTPKEDNTKVEKIEQTKQTEKTKTEHGYAQKIHIVEEGETLGSISQKYYGTTQNVDKIMNANDMADANLIFCGQELQIPN